MPYPVAFPVPETTIGLGLETSYGVPVAPQWWLPVMKPKFKPDLTKTPDETLIGNMTVVQRLVPGLRYDSMGWDSYPYMDTFASLLRAELGSPDTLVTAPTNTTLAAAATAGSNTVSLTASVAVGDWIVIGSGSTLETHYVTAVTGTGPYTATLNVPVLYSQPSGAAVSGLTAHQFSLLNNTDAEGNAPPTYTITDFDGEEWRQFPAGVLDKLTIKGDQTKIVDYTCDWFCNAFVTPTAPTPSFTTAAPPPSWTLQCLIGGVQVLNVQTWEFDFARAVKNIPGSTATQAYFKHFAGAILATGKFTVIEQPGAVEELAYLSNSTQAFDFTVYDVKNGWALNLHSSEVEYKTWELDRSKDNEEVTASIEFQMLPSSNDALAGGKSPVLATVANAVTTSY
jgi:hypothetical protein